MIQTRWYPHWHPSRHVKPKPSPGWRRPFPHVTKKTLLWGSGHWEHVWDGTVTWTAFLKLKQKSEVPQRKSRPTYQPTNLFVKTKSEFFCLLWINKVRGKDKTYIWVLVWWKTKTKSEKSTCLTYTGFLGVIRKTEALVRVFPTFTVRVFENTVWRKWNRFCCFLLIDKARAKDKTSIWLSVRWKTKT